MGVEAALFCILIQNGQKDFLVDFKSVIVYYDSLLLVSFQIVFEVEEILIVDTIIISEKSPAERQNWLRDLHKKRESGFQLRLDAHQESTRNNLLRTAIFCQAYVMPGLRFRPF
jgi:hypothetical protein